MGDVFTADLLSRLIIFIVVLLLAISAHEAAHAWMSHKFGDDTAFMLGRVTLNPVKHTDVIGTLVIPIAAFLLTSITAGPVPLLGWGKPTPVNPRNWTNYKTANVMVSIAGILANILIAVIGFVVLKTLLETGIVNAGNVDAGIVKPLMILFFNLIFLNVSLAVFNLLPFPPLDGSKVLSTFLPESFMPALELLEQFGFIILILLLYTGIIGTIIYPFYAVVDYLIRTPFFS